MSSSPSTVITDTLACFLCCKTYFKKVSGQYLPTITIFSRKKSQTRNDCYNLAKQGSKVGYATEAYAGATKDPRLFVLFDASQKTDYD